MEHVKHTFDPLPAGAHILFEANGDRIAEWKGITIAEISKERQVQEPVPTLEEANHLFATAKEYGFINLQIFRPHPQPLSQAWESRVVSLS